MTVIHNGVSARLLTSADWRRSRHSGSIGNCVELAPLVPAAMAVRNSRDPDGPALVFPSNEVAAFLSDAKDGAFDNQVT